MALCIGYLLIRSIWSSFLTTGQQGIAVDEGVLEEELSETRAAACHQRGKPPLQFDATLSAFSTYSYVLIDAPNLIPLSRVIYPYDSCYGSVMLEDKP